MDPYEELANAIIVQAVRDYRSAGRNMDIKEEIFRFIRSEWFCGLTDINPVMLERKLLEEDKAKAMGGGCA